MSYQATINATIIKEWISANLTVQAIETELLSKGWEQEHILEHLKEFKKQINAKKQIRGFIMMAFGAFLGFLSCLLTLTQVFPEWYDLILYGITFTGVSIVIAGLYFVLE